MKKFFLSVLMIIFMFNSNSVYACENKILPPYALKEGDTICLLSLSAAEKERQKILQERLPFVVDALKNRGFNVVVCDDLFKTTALDVGDGTEQFRADVFNKAVKDPAIKAIFAFWGGYGAMQVLDKIDYEEFRKNRKIFVGFSDITAAEMAIFQKSGIVTFHGPMVGASLNYKETITFDNLFDMLMNPVETTELKNIDDESNFLVYRPGDITGKVVGGNLCLLQNLVGTPYEPDYKGKILFIEEVQENAYKIHRMLWHLKLAGKLDNLAEIIIGSLTPVTDETETDLLKVCFDVFKDLDIPIIYNVHAGHINNPLTIPIGATLKISDGKIFVVEHVVQEGELRRSEGLT